MKRVGVPVDLFNPGQVFAALGFLEAAHMLCGGAEGGFNGSGGEDGRFIVVAPGGRNPFDVVLEFLAEAELERLAPAGYDEELGDLDAGVPLARGGHFPGPRPQRMGLPVRLRRDGQRLDSTHWCDGSSRDDFKLYAGNRSAARIARAMLSGDEKHGTRGVRDLWQQDRIGLVADPFNVLVALGGSFNLDPRAAWTRLDAGYSPNDHDHRVAASPVVEILAAIGLEHARPRRDRESGEVRYGAWTGLLPLSLARAALGCSDVAVPLRRFRFTLLKAGQNKVVTYAQEETA